MGRPKQTITSDPFEGGYVMSHIDVSSEILEGGEGEGGGVTFDTIASAFDRYVSLFIC